ncbi:MAG: hypothetical protein ACKOD9_22335, partial [Rubrivivax sp.]
MLPLPSLPSVPVESSAGMFALTRGRPAGSTVPEQGVWDELRMADGTWRATWCRFAEKVSLPAAGDLNADFDRRLQAIAAQIRRDGVTHNVFGPEGAVARPWSLELLPLLIEPADWAGIERGI